MEYDVLISIILYICSCFYLFLGIYAIISNIKTRTNRLFLCLALSMATWSFTYSIATSAPTAEASAFWRSISVFGGGVFYSFLLHFALMLTGVQNRLKNKRMIISLIYIPAVINIILFGPLGFLTEEVYQMVPSKFGWINMAPMNFERVWLISYYLIYTIVSIILLIRWQRKIEPRTIFKKQATHFLISVLISFFIGFGADILPDILGIEGFPKIATIFLTIPATLLFFSLKKFGFLFEKSKPVILFPKSDSDLNKDRSRLFQASAMLFMIGSVIAFLVGYFGLKKTLESQFSFSAIIFLIGLSFVFVPQITKNHSVQNILYLVVSSIGTVFFMIINADTAALTIWSTYIITLLITVILGSKINAFIFTILCVMIQIFFWITIPKITVVVGESEYITRILIIILSYYSVRYLINEYALKLQGYQGFAKEQESLERISTNFISVNSENAKEKIDEMFKISAEVLDFNQGYLVEFSEDYENVIILNTYIRDEATEALPFSPGMVIKTADFPVAKTLIAEKRSLECMDITNVPVDEDKGERNFFTLRGILSYYALPIIIENEISGMLVAEDYRKSDPRVRENQKNYLGVIVNILTDTKKKTLYEKKLYDYAYFDEMTKLANRNMLIKKLNQSIHDKKGSGKIAVLYVEIENLRMINDAFGHTVGDRIVIVSASILKGLLKECCYISRVENEAFVIVMPMVETIKQIQDCIDKIIESFSVPILPAEGKGTLFVTISIGVSMYPDDGKDADTLLQNADLAGYEAKHSNSKVVFCSDQLKNRIRENTLLTNKLFNALQNKEFSLEFQPQINSKTGKTAGVEALLRWNYDDKKRIPPDIFIPILEQTGLIHDVGLWVLEQALQEHNRLVARGFPPLRFSVNLSIIQFREDNFVPEIIKIIKESKVNPKYIELEITESFLSINFADTIAKLSKLKEFGVSIAIDDFGKGYSSLQRLDLVPFDRIKIDKSIVDDITLKTKKIVIVKTIVSLAKSLMAGITAEGVETKEQLDFLKNIDCDEIQEYYYSKPLPIEVLEEFLKKENA